MKLEFAVFEDGWVDITLKGKHQLVCKIKNLIDALELETN